MSVQISCPTYVKAVLDALHGAGYQAYIVGGCVRDSLLGNEPKDWDITTSALPEQTEQAAEAAGLKTFRTGIKHGTISVLSEGVTVECTTYRIDGAYKDSRHPESVKFTPSLEKDLARRDFTVNAMAAVHGADGWEIMDPFEGQKDLNAGIIRCVGNPIKRFGEDALRILRGVRFAVRLGFELEDKTANAMYACAGGLKSISRERVREELMGILQSPDPEGAVRIMKKRGLLKHVFPYADVTGAVRDVNQTPADKPLFRLAYLLYNTDEESVHKTTNDLKMSGADAGFVRTLLAFRAERLEISPLYARQMIAKYGDLTLPALALRTAKGEDTTALSKLVAEQMRAGVCVKISDLAVSGADLASVGIPKGKEMGRILHALLDAVMQEPTKNTKEQLLLLARQIYDI